MGNGYLTVQYMREPGSDEIFMSPLSYGAASFKVSLAQHQQPLTLSVPEHIKPGETLDMKLQSAEPGRVIVFAVDEGILQVARYKNPDPLSYFFQKRQLPKFWI
jgi:alpha-2-macroglobulin